MKHLFPRIIETRRYLASTALAVAFGFTTAAHAGSPETVIVEPVVTAPALPSWAGFYLGGNVGYAFDGSENVGHRDESGAFVTQQQAGTLDYEGFNYGLRLGWRGQRAMAARSFVYGIELGIDGGDVSDSFSTADYDASVDMNHVLGIRAKSGLTNRTGDTLFYGTLGYVHGDFDYTLKETAAAIDLDRSFSTDGYAVGLGIEHMINDRWSVNAEWEYLEFSGKRLYDGNDHSTKATPKFHNIQLGVNLRF